MSITDALKGLIFKKPPAAAEQGEPRRPQEPQAGGRRASEAENPYLAARRNWNDHVGGVVSQLRIRQMIGVLSLLIAPAGVGGVIHIGRQSKFIPYVVEVDKLGQTVASGPAYGAGKADPRVIHAAVADWISCARMVSPDVALQRKCVFKAYSMLAPDDPATPKMNEWLNGTPDSSPFERAKKEMVSVEIKTVIPQTPDTWQVEWEETTRDRQGIKKAPPVTMRALVTTYINEVMPNTGDEQLRHNPLSIYVRDDSWSRIQ